MRQLGDVTQVNISWLVPPNRSTKLGGIVRLPRESDEQSIVPNQAGRLDEAFKLREQALALDRKVLGPEHPETLAATLNLAISYRSAGRSTDAV
jgi:hypothetical protein